MKTISMHKIYEELLVMVCSITWIYSFTQFAWEHLGQFRDVWGMLCTGSVTAVTIYKIWWDIKKQKSQSKNSEK